MIIAIADDFSGAAELAGIGLRFGLTVEVQTNFNPKVYTDLLIIDSHTRSIRNTEAGRKVKSIAEQINKLKFEWLYKKIDSLLRGHIITEVSALLDVFPQKTILIVPANPDMGRIISEGKYTIDGIPIDKTDFFGDPAFPRRTDNVLELLNTSGDISIQILNATDKHDIENIVIGEVKGFQDLEAWAKRLTPKIIPAGASEFFTAILKSKGFKTSKVKNSTVSLSGKKTLMVSGSSSKQSSHFFESLGDNITGIGKFPCTLNYLDAKGIKKYLDTIISAYHSLNFLMLFIDQEAERILHRPEALTMSLTKIAEGILNEIPISELIIEGGDTASAIMKKMQWESFIPEQEWGPGVVRMRIPKKPKVFLTTKPGSYPWPQGLIQSWIRQ